MTRSGALAPGDTLQEARLGLALTASASRRAHPAVVEAIAARDPPGAAAAMQRPFDSVKSRFLSWLARA